MTQAGTIVRPASRGWLLPAFLLIIGVFTFGNLAVFLSTKKMQATNRETAQNAMMSIEEVNRIIHDIDQERLLVDAHILSPDEQVHIFEPFFRSARVQSLPGTGLCLSIVKRIVEASEGTIAVKSKVGIGTTFQISLPLAGPAAGSPAPGEERRAS